MLRLENGLLLMVLGDSAVEVGRITSAIVEFAGAQEIRNLRSEASVSLDVRFDAKAFVEEMVVIRAFQEPTLAYHEVRGFARRRGKGERKRNRGSRWA